MLTQAEALERAERLRTGCGRWRSYWDAKWAINLAYEAGQQWAYANTGPAGVRRIMQLHEKVDPNSINVRVVFDMVAKNVRRTVASLKPHKLAASTVVRSESSADLIAKQVYDALLLKMLREIKGLAVWRSAMHPCCVMGTFCIRRELYTIGGRKTVGFAGEGAERKAVGYRDTRVRWARVMPFEILRDPSCMSADPNESDTIIGHEKPRSTDWVRRNFGKEIQTETKLGQLLDYQNQIGSVTGSDEMRHAMDSTTPAIVAEEFWFQDPDEPQKWPWHLIAYLDPNSRETTGETRLQVLRFGRNPFWKLPLHFIGYQPRVIGPWPRGMPELIKGIQDIRNLAVTSMVRVMLAHVPQWRVEKGTVDDPRKVFTNRSDQIIEFERHKPTDHIPDRIPAPGPPPTAEQMLWQLGDEGADAVNLSPAQFGRMVKRGTSGRGFELQLEAADVPLEDLRGDHRLVLNELLTGTLIDGVRQLRFRPDRVRELLGEEFPRDQLAAAIYRDPAKVIAAVEARPDSLRPRTPSQVQKDFTDAVTSQIVDSQGAKREMLAQGDVVMDTRMAEAWRKQQLEIARMKVGLPVVVTVGEDHSTSMWCIEILKSSPKWCSLTEEIQELITKHWADHRLAMQEEALSAQIVAEGQQGSAGMPSPPRDRNQLETSALAAPGSVGPVANVAG